MSKCRKKWDLSFMINSIDPFNLDKKFSQNISFSIFYVLARTTFTLEMNEYTELKRTIYLVYKFHDKTGITEK